MTTIMKAAESKKMKSKVRGWLEGNKLQEALEAQGASGRGDWQVLTLMSADSIVSVDLNWHWHEANYALDAALQEWLNKARRYGKNTFPLSDKQIAWAAGYLQKQFNRAAAL